MITIPDETFAVMIDGESDERLVIPMYGVGNKSWKDWKLRWLRSMHLRPDHSIISVGWPKFMNLGEGTDKYNVGVDRLLAESGKEMFATLKVDGSLLIRYVRDGKVCWRTRGSFRVGVENSDEVGYFCRKYPELADPKLYPGQSMLFEWVSPRNKIVITYDEPELFLIGGVDYDQDKPWWDANCRLLSMSELETVSYDFGVELTNFYPLNTANDVTRLIDTIDDNTEIEGFVVRFDGCQQMVKLKTDHYRTLHALRSCLTTAMLIDLWLQWGRPSFSKYAELFDRAYDYECWQWAIGAVSCMYDGIKTTQKIYQHIREFVDANIEMGKNCRRDFALLAQQKYDGLRLSACFTMLDGKEPSDDFWKKMILQNCKQVELRMFDVDQEDV